PWGRRLSQRGPAVARDRRPGLSRRGQGGAPPPLQLESQTAAGAVPRERAQAAAALPTLGAFPSFDRLVDARRSGEGRNGPTRVRGAVGDPLPRRGDSSLPHRGILPDGTAAPGRGVGRVVLPSGGK